MKTKLWNRLSFRLIISISVILICILSVYTYILINNLDEYEINLVKKISEFPEIISKSADKMNPALVANYTYELAKTFNEFYHNSPVIGSEEQQFRLKLVDCFSQEDIDLNPTQACCPYI